MNNAEYYFYKKEKAPPNEVLFLKVCVYSIKEGKFAK